MRAVWYEGFGPAEKVLNVTDMPDPTPREGEVLVRLRATGVNPSDVKLRAGARPGAKMAWPRVIPHSDGAGVIEAVGKDVEASRVGERVWIWNAQWRRPFGTAAELIALPAEQAVPLPGNTSFAEGACLGIPAMTGCFALFSDGPISGKTVLVHGGAGAAGRYACQMAALGGARVITTVSSLEKAAHSTADEWVNYRETDTVEAVMDMTDGRGVDRIVDVDFGTNQEVNLALIREGGVISAYASAGVMEPKLQFYPFMFKNITLRMMIVYLMPPELRREGERRLGEWLSEGLLSHAVIDGGSLADTAKAHDLVARGDKLGTVVLNV